MTMGGMVEDRDATQSGRGACVTIKEVLQDVNKDIRDWKHFILKLLIHIKRQGMIRKVVVG